MNGNSNTVRVAADVCDWVAGAVRLNAEQSEMLNKWKSGERQPTFNQLEKFSNKISIPLGFLLLKEPPVEAFEPLKYRTINSVSKKNDLSRELADTIYQMEKIRHWMREYMIRTDSDKIFFVGSLKAYTKVKDIAAYIRERLNIEENWYENSQSAESSFKTLREKISQMGIIVMKNGVALNNTRRPLDVNEFRAFTLIDDYAPLVFINGKDSITGNLFSLVHEIVHVGLGTGDFFNEKISDSKEETVSNAVAAEILIPNLIFIAKWAEISENRSDSTIADFEIIDLLAKYFKCSSVVVARRAYDNGFISWKKYNNLAADVNQKAKSGKKQGGGDYYNTAKNRIDNRFLRALAYSVQEGATLYTEAYRLTNTNVDTFNRLIEKVFEENEY